MTIPPMLPTQNDLPLASRKQAVQLLNRQLADSVDLYSQIKQAHWNVKGMQFHQLHELFDQLAGAVEDHVDLIAERVAGLGGIALGTVRVSAASSRLPEYPLDAIESRVHINALVTRFAGMARTTREAIDTTGSIGDAATADLFTEISRELDKQLWMLEAHLAG